MTKIIGIERLGEIIPGVGHGDNWHMTWAADDKQYTSLCDGEGFDLPGDAGKYNNSRIYAITGDPPDHRFEYLPGYPQLDGGNGFYNFGILALGSRIYSFMSHMVKTPDREYELAFVGARLIYSPDNGKTWNNHDGSLCNWENAKEPDQKHLLFLNEPDDSFSLLTVLQMGRDYEHNVDGYVYIYAPNGNEPDTMTELVLCRTPRDKLLDRSAYEFHVASSGDGSARWSTDVRDRRPVWRRIHEEERHRRCDGLGSSHSPRCRECVRGSVQGGRRDRVHIRRPERGQRESGGRLQQLEHERRAAHSGRGRGLEGGP